MSTSGGDKFISIFDEVNVCPEFLVCKSMFVSSKKNGLVMRDLFKKVNCFVVNRKTATLLVVQIMTNHLSESSTRLCTQTILFKK